MRPIAAHPLSDPHARSAIVIDHDPDHALALVTSLRQQGFTVREASDGFTGVALAQRHQPDLVVLSLELPGIDGFETTRRVRAFSDAFVMMLSDDDSESAAVEAFRAGSLTLGWDGGSWRSGGSPL